MTSPNKAIATKGPAVIPTRTPATRVTYENPVFAHLTDEDRALPDRLYWERVAVEAEKLGDGWLVRYAVKRAQEVPRDDTP